MLVALLCSPNDASTSGISASSFARPQWLPTVVSFTELQAAATSRVQHIRSLEKPQHHLRSVNLDNIPMSPVKQPSRLQLMDTQERCAGF